MDEWLMRRDAWLEDECGRLTGLDVDSPLNARDCCRWDVDMDMDLWHVLGALTPRRSDVDVDVDDISETGRLRELLRDDPQNW